VPGAEDCSVTLTSGTYAFSPASAGDLARRLDENQFNLGQGPCLDAGSSGETLVIDDVDEDDRWPAYLSLATVIGLGSSVSVPLPLQQEFVGALNFYSRTPRAFDAEGVQLCRQLCAHVAAVLSSAQLTESLPEPGQLEESAHTRAVIEQAKGILMARERCSPDEAFDMIRRASQRENRKLRLIAEGIVSRATSPTRPRPPS
jgi:GAF domain-containing protein